jgi:hypothetical protein
MATGEGAGEGIVFPKGTTNLSINLCEEVDWAKRMQAVGPLRFDRASRLIATMVGAEGIAVGETPQPDASQLLVLFACPRADCMANLAIGLSFSPDATVRLGSPRVDSFDSLCRLRNEPPAIELQ